MGGWLPSRDQMLRSKGLVHLQGIGRVQGKLAEQMNVGDKIGYNYGYHYDIVGKEDKGKAFIHFKVKDPQTGKIYSQRKKRGSLVPM